jgi:subtilase family serine protease
MRGNLRSRLGRTVAACLVAAIIAVPAALGQGPQPIGQGPQPIGQGPQALVGATPGRLPISSTHTEFVALPGHVHRLALPRFDAGGAPNSLRMGGLEIVFAKTPAQEQALEQLLLDQQDSKSTQYHRWLTPAEYGRRFGATDATVAAVTQWLTSSGFEVGVLPAGRGHLTFSGSEPQVESAFHTRIHLFNVNGERHFSNVSDPMIPAALKSAILAIRGLNDFYPKAGVMSRGRFSRTVPPSLAGKSARVSPGPDTYYPGSDQYPGYVGPTDFATIYNLLPAYQQGITGAGVTVAIAGQSDVDPSVLTTFWTAFGVAGPQFGLPAQAFSSIPVPGGTDPGQTMDGNEDEAYLDTEIVGALAPGATIVLVRDQDVGVAAQYVVDQNLAAVLNVSFGECEQAEAAANATVNAVWEQGVSEGITITVAAADAGVAACTAEADLGNAGDVNSGGFAVNALASTPYDLAVGGTDFNDLNPGLDALYWTNTNQTTTLSSAISHIPEMAWNDSCANPVISAYFGASSPLVFCNTPQIGTGSSATANGYIDILGSGGGVSSCTTLDGNGNCSGGYPQPPWQQGVLGIGTFGARALPDVSMISTRWLVCSYDTTPCDPTQAPTFNAGTGTIEVLDGTSAAAPSVAAILALIDQTQISPTRTDGRQGLVNTTLYTLAATEYSSAANLTACNASQGRITGAACIFYDVTAGSNAQPCSVANYATNSGASLPASTCIHDPGESTGIMGIGGTQDYAAGAGYDLATGLGSINAAALIAAFQANPAPTGLAASASGQTVTLTWTADPNATAGYDIYEGMAPGAISLTPVQRNVMGTTATIPGLQFSQTYAFAIAAVSASATSPFSVQVQTTIVPAPPAGLTVAPSGAGSLTLTWDASGSGTYDIFEAGSPGAEGATAFMSGYSGTTLTLSSLTPGKQYFFTVEGIDAGGASAPSAEAGGTVLPTAPSGLRATGGNGSVSLTWTAGAGAATYDIYDGTSASALGAQPVLTGITGTAATVNGLGNGTTYYFTVAAVNAGGRSSASAQAEATPAAPKGGGGSLDGIGLAILGGLVVARGMLRPGHRATSAGPMQFWKYAR